MIFLETLKYVEVRMDAKQATDALSALAHETRLAAFRLLVERGPDGMPAGSISDRLGISPSSMTFHLKLLAHAGLVTQRRLSRQQIYSADFAAMNELVAYLTENCCGGIISCAPVCNPAETGRASTLERKSA